MSTTLAPRAVTQPTQTAASIQARPQAFPTSSTTPDFVRFGTWGEEISVVRDGAIQTMAYELATHPRRKQLSANTLWQECSVAQRKLLRTYQIVTLDSPSFFLPQGEVVFKVIQDPIQLPDNPPQGVMMRHLEAMMAHPLAKFYLLEPVFTSEPHFRLYTASDLREEATGDRRVCERLAWQWGWAHRGGRWTRQRARELGGMMLRATAWMVERLAENLTPPPRARRSRVHESTALLADSTLHALVRRSEHDGLDYDARRLRRAIQELRWRSSLDPVLCFELPERPGELWFESHWFTGSDGRRYVHY